MRAFVLPLREAIIVEQTPPPPPAGSTPKPGEQSKFTKQSAERVNKLASQALASLDALKQQLAGLQREVGAKSPSLTDAAIELANAIKLVAPKERALRAFLPVSPPQPEQAEKTGQQPEASQLEPSV